MEQGIKTTTRHYALEAFGFAFKWWLFIFVTVLLPLDLLYRFGSLWIALSWHQIVIQFASLVFFCAIVAFCIASASLVASLLLLLTRQGTAITEAVNAFIGLYFLFMMLLSYSYRWAMNINMIYDLSNNIIYYLSTNIKNLIYCIFIGLYTIIIIIFWKKIYLRFTEIVSWAFKINIITVLVCLILTFFIISINLFGGFQGTNKTFTAQKNSRLTDSPNIIIITFDALCAKHTSLYGFTRDTTPELVKLGRESYVFNNMYSSSNWTLPSLASLLTGRHPNNHRMLNNYSLFMSHSPKNNLMCILKEAGYETAVSVANAYTISWKLQLQGVDHVYSRYIGFEDRNNIMKLCYQYGIYSGTWLSNIIVESLFYKIIIKAMHSAWFDNPSPHLRDPLYFLSPEKTFGKAANFLRKMQQPLFLWVHILPPHAPYIPRNNFLYTFLPEKTIDNYRDFSIINGRYSKDWTYKSVDQPLIDKLSFRYDEHIFYGDHELGKFLSLLKETGIYEKSIVIVSADHGESFERNFWQHGGPYLYQTLINVPLVIHLPGQTLGKRIEANVSHVDIAPTILDFLGIEAPAWMDGKSFKKALYDNRFDTGTKFSMNLTLQNAPDNFQTPSIAAIHGEYKLINYLAFNQYEMYNLRRDPKEENNLVGVEPERFFALQKEIDHILARY